MRLYFVVVIVAILTAAACGAALSWDGAYVLLRALDGQAPFVAHRRLISIPLQLPAILASRLTEDPRILAAIFSLSYAHVPIVSLGAAWWIVKDKAKHLFIWPALGIGFGTLPMQFGFISEALIAVQLSWPVLMGLLVGMPGRQAPVVFLFAVAALLSHPFGFAMAAVSCTAGLAYGVKHPSSRRRPWVAAASLAGLTMVTAAGFWTLRSPYEAEQMTGEALRHAFETALAGRPIQALAFAWAAAVLIALEGAPRTWWRLPSSILWPMTVLSAGCASVLFVLWGQDPHNWRSALNARSWLLVLTAPFLLMAVIDGLRTHQGEPGLLGQRWWWRLRVIQVSGLVFLAVLFVQTVAWVRLSGQLELALRESQSVYLPRSSLGWMRETPLDVWSTNAHSVLLQGRVPRRLVVGPGASAEPHLAPGPPIAPWWVRPWDEGWFQMRLLREELIAEVEAPGRCWFAFGDGWHGLERNEAGWWRWNSGNGLLSIHVRDSSTARLSGGVSSFRQPNRIAVVVNGRETVNLEASRPGTQPLGPLPLRLQRGRNVVEFRGEHPAERPPADDRLVAVALHSLVVLSDNELVPCELRP